MQLISNKHIWFVSQLSVVGVLGKVDLFPVVNLIGTLRKRKSVLAKNARQLK